MAELLVYGPYETEAATRGEPLPSAVSGLHNRDLVGETMLAHLTAACEAAGVELGAFDLRILRWLAGWEPSTVQVIIGLISRAFASGHAAGEAGR